ncbi:GMC oxidoreductase [Rhodocollybia butyracea]|uniref:GMC oxidoreductase n=1 Tax=Rhodocollybia butyracea TaxID=206335 RepID=A0A9P5PPV9_9AGAR|nr:GMC oxidoreductase [Rhodocollybia butyracea]
MLPLSLQCTLGLILVYAGVLRAALVSRENLGLRSLGGLAPIVTGQDQEFDFVVIGGGTAGITVAARLAEDSSVTVALIEAGSFYELDNAPLSSTPFGDLFGVGTSSSEIDPNIDWGFMTVPFPGANDRVIHYACGKTLGGTSARNFMLYQRPTVRSLQFWADNVEDQSYNWHNFLPYFEKSVHFTPPDTKIRAAKATVKYNPDAFVPTGGPLQVSFPYYTQPFASYLPGGFDEIGISPATDFSSGTLDGAQYFFDLTMAKKILFDSQKNAIGVQVNVTGFPVFNLKATKEVIVLAGVFQSPQLLMVSGIGPSTTLNEFRIPVIVDNANVGQNMWDHVLATITFPIVTDSPTRYVNDPVYQADSIAQWETDGTGPLSSNNADYLAWEKVSDFLDPEYFPSDWPELEYICSGGYFGNVTAPAASQPTSGNYGTIAAGLVAPLSRGNVTIISADTNDLPLINPNWLDHPSDQAIILAGFKRAREVFASKAVQRGLAGPEFYPGAQYQTDEELMEVIRASSMTIWHASATCKMGALSDPLAVIDSHAQVIGVQKLRVVDASSSPILPPGHPQSPVYALAEKIVDDIKAAWNLKL